MTEDKEPLGNPSALLASAEKAFSLTLKMTIKFYHPNLRFDMVAKHAHLD